MNIKKELPIWAIMVLPLAYLAFVWNGLASEVPMHYNLSGEVDRWGSKTELIFLAFFMPFITYISLALIPIIDPKQKIDKMGGKFYQLKLLFVGIMSLIACFIIYVTDHPEVASFNIILILVGLTFTVLGNYFPSIAPNYFLGIRTPWTLESPEVWKQTHRLAGKLWVVGGLIIMVLAFLWQTNHQSLGMILSIIISILVFIPITYSFVKFRTLKKLE